MKNNKLFLFVSFVMLVSVFFVFSMKKKDEKEIPVIEKIVLEKDDEGNLIVPKRRIATKITVPCTITLSGISYFYRKRKPIKINEDFLIKDKPKNSKFFKLHICEWAMPSNSLDSIALNSVQGGTYFGFPLYLLHDAYRKRFSGGELHLSKAFKTTELDELRQELIKGLSCRYKLHFQVKPEYVISVFKDLAEFFKKNNYICVMKTRKQFSPGIQLKDENGNPPKDAYPMIVAYVTLLPGNKEEKNNILNKIVNSVVDRYKKIKVIKKDDTGKVIEEKYVNGLEHLYIGYPPRCNMQIDGFLFIAGGDAYGGVELKAYGKIPYKQDVEAGKIKNTVYTDDYAFFKGHEFEYKPTSK